MLNIEDYSQYYEKCSVVLIPYDPLSFANRTSGQLIDALMTGKPVVCSHGTWAAGIVDALECGITFDFNEPAQAADAIESIRKEYSIWVDKVHKAKIKWLSNNSCESFLRKCLAFAQ